LQSGWRHFTTLFTVGCWSALNSTHSFGSKPVPGITNVLECQTACLSDSACFAIDYDHNNRGRLHCWLVKRRNY